jgi:hypothetical protein
MVRDRGVAMRQQLTRAALAEIIVAGHHSI